MIIAIEPAQVSVVDYTKNPVLEHSISRSEFLEKFSEIGDISGIVSANYEPDTNLYHVFPVGGPLESFQDPTENSIIGFLHSNVDAIADTFQALFDEALANEAAVDVATSGE